jgi:hypothetical protein
MPIATKLKVPGFRFDGSGKSFQSASVEHTKNNGGSWFNVAHNTKSGCGNNPDGRKGIPHRTAGHWTNPAEHEGVKQRGSGREWFAGEGKISRMTSSKSNARKAASAQSQRKVRRLRVDFELRMSFAYRGLEVPEAAKLERK